MKRTYGTKGIVKAGETGRPKTPRVYRGLKNRYLPIIIRHVVKNNGTAEDGEDIFHDALIIFLRKMESSQADLQCSPGTFLFSIARNLWKKRLRRLKLHHEVVNTLDIPLVQEPVGLYEGRPAALNALRKAFLNLPCPCRRLLNFFYFHQKRYDEIIQLMDISSIQVAKNQKLRCMKKLKKRLSALMKTRQI